MPLPPPGALSSSSLLLLPCHILTN
jgi:hypothetical protein